MGRGTGEEGGEKGTYFELESLVFGEFFLGLFKAVWLFVQLCFRKKILRKFVVIGY